MMFRLLAALGAALVMFGASATLAFADGDVERSWVAAESFSFDALQGSTNGDPIDADAFASKMRAIVKEHERTISTPGAKAERQDSIDAFTDLGRSAAATLINDVFVDALDALTLLPSDPLLASESSPKFIRGSDTSVRIDPPGSQDSQLVVSSLPLRNDDGQIVSGRLKANPDGFVPDAPLANVVLPGDADGSVVLSDVDVELSFAGAAGSPGQMVDVGAAPGKEMVLYPNTQTDTDTAVTYTLQGIETFNFLRSAESPERLSLDYQLPDGASLQATADGGAIVLDSEGVPLVTVFPPFAVDAQGSDVPMTLSIEGSSVGLNVPHRGEDFAYPIMVDPVQHVRNWWTNGSSADFQGWTFHQSGTSNYANSLTCPPALATVDPCGSTGAGVYVSAVPGKHYPANSKGYWRWTVPGGPSSSIVSAVLDSWRYRKGNQNAGWAFYNLHHTNGTSTGHNVTAGGGGSNLYMYGGNSGWKYLHSGLMTNTANTIPSGALNYRYNRIAAYTANLTDGEAPTLSLGVAPTGWLGPSTSFNVQATAQDPGLGLYTIQANVNDNWTSKWFGWCLGTYPLSCTTNTVNQLMAFNSNDFPTGVRSVAVKASDVLTGTGHETTKHFTVKVDKTDPTITTSGTLTNTPFRGDLPRHTFDFDIRDGNSGSSQSGVAKVTIKLDDQLISSYDTPCANQNCFVTSNETWEFDAEDWGYDVPHVLDITAEDTVGNVSTEQINFTFVEDETPPVLALGTFPSGRLNANPEVTFAATDVGHGATHVEATVGGEGVEAVTNEVDCRHGDCSYSGTLKLDLRDIPSGDITVQFVATDGGGNESAPITRTIQADTGFPEVSLTGGLLAFDEAPMDSGAAVLNVEASDDFGPYDTGIGEIEVFLNGNSVASKVNPCLPACPDSDSYSYNFDRDLAGAGPHEIRIETTDGIGNVTTEEITVDAEPEVAQLTCEADPPATQTSGTPISPETAATALATNVSPLAENNSSVTNSLNGEMISPAFIEPDPGAGLMEDELTDDFQDLNPTDEYILDEAHPAGTASSDEVPEVKVADHLCLTAMNTTPDAEPGVQINDSTILYANTATDTDTAVRATATGVAIIYTLRGALAPDTFKLAAGFDPMGELEMLPDGTLALTLPQEEHDEEDYEDPEDDPSTFNLDWLSDAERQQSDGVFYLNNAQEQVTSRTVIAVMPEPYAEDSNGDEIPVVFTLNAGVLSMKLSPLPNQNPVAPYTLVASASATPTRNDCKGGSPCGRFKRNKAAKWARTWGNRGAHPWYHYYGYDNCTNFISGALYTSHNPKYYGRGGGNVMMSNEYAQQTMPGTWYYRRTRSGGWSNSTNWRLANLLPRYLYKYKLADKISGNPANWRRGDIVAYQRYYKDPNYPSGKGVYIHLQMVSNVNKNGVPLLAQDAGTHYGEKNWKRIVADLNRDWGKYRTGNPGSSVKKGWGYHVIRPKHRGMNVGSNNVRHGSLGDA